MNTSSSPTESYLVNGGHIIVGFDLASPTHIYVKKLISYIKQRLAKHTLNRVQGTKQIKYEALREHCQFFLKNSIYNIQS